VKWWVIEHSKLARNSISIMFAHVSFENREFSSEYISTQIELVSREQSLFIRLFERPLLRIVQVNDKLQGERIKRTIHKLHELFKLNTSCFIQCDSIIEIVLKLSLRCPDFAMAMIKNHTDFCKTMERWCRENPTLPIVGQSKLRVFKEGQGIRWSDIKSNFLN